MELPGWLASREQLPAKHYGPRFQAEPWLLVIHSGELGPGVAEYFAEPGDGRLVSAHFAWSKQLYGFAQCVPLSHVAWHCGGSRYKGRGKLNFCSIGVELPGPWDKARDEIELGELRRLAQDLILAVPSLRVAVRHSDIDQQKKDPGPGFRWGCVDGLGLETGG